MFFYKFCILFTFLLYSCQSDTINNASKNVAENKKDTTPFHKIGDETKKSSAVLDSNKKNTVKDTTIQQDFTDCEKYWKLHFPTDSIRINYLNEILKINQLSENNQKFITQLKNVSSSKLVVDNAIFPIFRSNKSQIGVLAFPNYGNKNDAVTAETKLLENINIDYNLIKPEEYDKVRFYPQLLDSVYRGKEKPAIYYYTNKERKKTRIKDLGILLADCTEYFEYSFDTRNINLSDTILFGSPFQIDLIYENNMKVDSLIKNEITPTHCFDCPSSSHLSKTFARLKGTTNIYFVFADTFPLNNELDTPSRALVLLTDENTIIYLWNKEIDLFGCPCL
ncbi:hypothetical protein V9L05_22755 (plasmid) [Bernardetia sp. Wsw4-3y2]|uniref:hypothetical protein n=1 Tax=Bernardetia sp. Wsw4-3y2 TaxID=3127471 RepID=UPI0030CFA638